MEKEDTRPVGASLDKVGANWKPLPTHEMPPHPVCPVLRPHTPCLPGAPPLVVGLAASRSS